MIKLLTDIAALCFWLTVSILPLSKETRSDARDGRRLRYTARCLSEMRLPKAFDLMMSTALGKISDFCVHSKSNHPSVPYSRRATAAVAATPYGKSSNQQGRGIEEKNIAERSVARDKH